jgi:hypothetical protein
MSSCATAGAKKDDSQHVRVGKFNLVDLAGSERQDKTGATGEGRAGGHTWGGRGGGRAVTRGAARA